MKSLLILILNIVLASPLNAQSKPSTALMLSCAVVDTASTEWILQHGGRELNPVLYKQQLPIKAGIVAGFYLLNRVIGKRNKSISTKLNYAASSLWCGAGIWNMKGIYGRN